MKKYLLLLLILAFGCKPIFVTHYVLVPKEPIPIYWPNTHYDVRFEDSAVGDTLEYFTEARKPFIPNNAEVKYKTMQVEVRDLYKNTRLLSSNKINRRKFLKIKYDYSIGSYQARFKPFAITPAYKTTSQPVSSPNLDWKSTPTNGAPIHTGPRGGKYYINSHGNKSYIKRK